MPSIFGYFILVVNVCQRCFFWNASDKGELLHITHEECMHTVRPSSHAQTDIQKTKIIMFIWLSPCIHLLMDSFIKICKLVMCAQVLWHAYLDVQARKLE